MSFVSSLALSCDAAAHQLSDTRRAQTVAAALDPLLDEADRILCKVAADGSSEPTGAGRACRVPVEFLSSLSRLVEADSMRLSVE